VDGFLCYHWLVKTVILAVIRDANGPSAPNSRMIFRHHLHHHDFLLSELRRSSGYPQHILRIFLYISHPQSGWLLAASYHISLARVPLFGLQIEPSAPRERTSRLSRHPICLFTAIAVKIAKIPGVLRPGDLEISTRSTAIRSGDKGNHMIPSLVVNAWRFLPWLLTCSAASTQNTLQGVV